MGLRAGGRDAEDDDAMDVILLFKIGFQCMHEIVRPTALKPAAAAAEAAAAAGAVSTNKGYLSDREP